MVEIHLTRGLVALVDDADLPLVASYKWQAMPRRDGKGWYAQAHVPGSGKRGEHQRNIRMHRLLVPAAARVDHKNGNGLDCQRENLRPCTQSQNIANSTKRIGTSSQFKGVYFRPSSRRWLAQIQCGHHRYLGSFASELDAAKAYNAAALALFGEFAKVNPIDDAAPCPEAPPEIGLDPVPGAELRLRVGPA